MMIPPRVLSALGVRPSGVLHVGAHEAEELAWYVEEGWGPTIWVEMLPDKAKALRDRFAGDKANVVIEAACWSSERPLTVHRARNGQSSSLMAPKEHLAKHPHITFEDDTYEITTRRLDDLLAGGPYPAFDFVNIDAQGAELEILRGLGAHIDHLRWAYVEVNEIEHYEGCALLPQMDEFLASRGFARAIRLKADEAGWGDALYVRRDDPSAGKLALLTRGYYAWKRLRRPQHTPPWDNWR